MGLDIDIIEARHQHLPEIIALLAQDKLGATREKPTHPLPVSYEKAFLRISESPDHLLMVVLAQDEVIGTFQLSFLQYLTYQGGIRAQIEAVRVKETRRAQGLGATMFKWAIERARAEGAHVIQLTTDKQRPEARRFYENLGFKASHEGMKLHL